MKQGCLLFSILVSDLDEGKSQEVSLDDHPILHKFVYVFLRKILGMLPKCDIYFCIDHFLGEEPISRAPYHMTTKELI